jgi:hypothetical protein
MMIEALHSAATLTDDQLLLRVRALAQSERAATAHLIAALVEMDTRRLYLGQGCSSLFTYCTQVLHLSEHAAYGRIEAARVVRKFPAILDLLAAGSVHLTAIGLLAPHLTDDNHVEVLAAAHHKSKRDVEELVVSLRPQPPVPSTMRKLPTPRPGPARRETSVNRTDMVTCMGSEEPKTNPAVAPPARPSRAEVRPLAPDY